MEEVATCEEVVESENQTVVSSSENPIEWDSSEVKNRYPAFTRHFFKTNQKGKLSAIRRAVKTNNELKIRDFKKAVQVGHVSLDSSKFGRADVKLLEGIGFHIEK